MSDLELGTDGDLLVVDGDLRLTDGVDSRKQHVAIRLQTFLGEWFLDTTVGVPYFQQIFADKNPNTVVIQSILRREILKTPGVTGVTDIAFTFDNETRVLTVTAAITSVDGEFEVAATVGV